MMGFVSVAETMREDKVRAKPEKFADHYSQAKLFWRSQTPTEKSHIVSALRFELTRVGVPAIRERMLSVLLNVDPTLARGVADGLGLPLPAAQPLALEPAVESEVEASAGLSLFARPGDGSVKGRRVALLAVDGVDGPSLREAYDALAAAQAAPRYVGLRLGRVQPADGEPIEVETTIEAMPSVLWDAAVLPAGATALRTNGQALDFIKDQYRHCKPMLLLGDASKLLSVAGIPRSLADDRPDPGLVLAGAKPKPAADADSADGMQRFIAALARHRHYERELDPPAV